MGLALGLEDLVVDTDPHARQAAAAGAQRQPSSARRLAAVGVGRAFRTGRPLMADLPATTPITDWTTANTSTRDGAKWVVVALALLGATLFGAAPVVRGLTLSWQDPDDRTQLIAAIVVGTIGLTGMILLIFRVGRTLLPVTAGYADLSDTTKAYFDANQATHLPPGTSSVDQLARQLEAARIHCTQLESQLASIDPPVPDWAKDDLAAARARVDDLAAWMGTVTSFEENKLLQERFWGPANEPGALVTLVILAAGGAIGFNFALAQAPATAASGGGGGTAKVGYLEPGTDPEASEELWQNLGLAACEISGRVPVVVLAGGDDGDYTVRTIAPPGSACDEWQFSVIAETASVTISAAPKPVEIEYSPRPEPTP
mgnify:CR=1 FL=1|jgi:hypothetical protein